MAAVQQPVKIQRERGVIEDSLLATARLLLAKQEVDVNIQEPVSVPLVVYSAVGVDTSLKVDTAPIKPDKPPHAQKLVLCP